MKIEIVVKPLDEMFFDVLEPTFEGDWLMAFHSGAYYYKADEKNDLLFIERNGVIGLLWGWKTSPEMLILYTNDSELTDAVKEEVEEFCGEVVISVPYDA